MSRRVRLTARLGRMSISERSHNLEADGCALAESVLNLGNSISVKHEFAYLLLRPMAVDLRSIVKRTRCFTGRTELRPRLDVNAAYHDATLCRLAIDVVAEASRER